MEGPNKAVICLGTGKSQIPVIQAAKKIGLTVIGVDRDEQSPGCRYCEECINHSTHDADPILNAVYNLRREYDIIGILNRSSGPPVVTAAYLAAFLGLDGVPPESAEIAVDKSRLMAFCRVHGIDAPRCLSIDSLDKPQVKTIMFPAVVKPALSAVGKDGVMRVPNEKSFPAAFNAAQAVSLTGLVNVEEWVAGQDITLMAMVQKGKLYPVVLLDELNGLTDHQQVYGMGFAVPSRFWQTPVFKQICHLAQKVVEKLSLTNTPLNLSCRCDGRNSPRLIEIHLDMGGDLILDELLPASTSFDVLAYICRMLVHDYPWPMEAVFKPRAVLYQKGDGLVTDRPFTLVSGNSREELETVMNRINEET